MSESIPATSWEGNTLMRMLALILISALSLASSSAFAASYQLISGTIIDPIQYRGGGNHPHSGNNLEPGANLADANLFFADLTNADLNNASLVGANLSFATLTGANLAGANLTNALLDVTILIGADLTGADLSNAFLFLTSFSNADLTNATLTNADLGSADLDGAILTNADLSGSDLDGADLSGAKLTSAILANAVGLGTSTGAALYDINTDFTNAWADGDWGTPGTILFDPVAAGWTLVPVPEPSTALLMSLGLAGLAARRR